MPVSVTAGVAELSRISKLAYTDPQGALKAALALRVPDSLKDLSDAVGTHIVWAHGKMRPRPPEPGA